MSTTSSKLSPYQEFTNALIANKQFIQANTATALTALSEIFDSIETEKSEGNALPGNYLKVHESILALMQVLLHKDDENPLVSEIGSHGINNVRIALGLIEAFGINVKNKQEELYRKSKNTSLLRLHTLDSIMDILATENLQEDSFLQALRKLFSGIIIKNEEYVGDLLSHYEGNNEYVVLTLMILSEMMTNAYKYGSDIVISFVKGENGTDICIENIINEDGGKKRYSTGGGQRFFDYIKRAYGDVFSFSLENNNTHYKVVLTVKDIRRLHDVACLGANREGEGDRIVSSSIQEQEKPIPADLIAHREEEQEKMKLLIARLSQQEKEEQMVEQLSEPVLA